MRMRDVSIALALGAVVMSKASGQFNFQRVAYTQTTHIPDTNLFFDDFLQPVVSQGHVYFRGSKLTNGERQGLYEFAAGNLSTVADQSTLIPNSNTPFAGFLGEATPDMRGLGSQLAFNGSNGSISGVYLRSESGLSVVADTRDNSTYGDRFRNIRFRDFNGQATAFVGLRSLQGGGLPGIYRKEGGVLSLIADTNTPVPNGTGTFQNTSGQFGSAPFVDNRITFDGTDSAGRSGIYQETGSGISRVFDTTMEASNGDGMFLGMGNVTSGGGADFAFIAMTAAAPTGAIYAVRSGQLSRLLTNDTAIGDGHSVLNGGYAMSSDGSLVWYNIDGGGVYTTVGGAIQPILRPFDQIDGKTVAAVDFSTLGRDGDQVALYVRYTTDNPDLGFYDRAVYLVTLPGPGGAAALGAGLAVAGGRRRK